MLYNDCALSAPHSGSRGYYFTFPDLHCPLGCRLHLDHSVSTGPLQCGQHIQLINFRLQLWLALKAVTHSF